LNTWKIVNPNPISDSAVRMTDISVRSALIRVRWKDMPVRREESSTDMESVSELISTGLSWGSDFTLNLLGRRSDC
jgi:hypothetical protein